MQLGFREVGEIVVLQVLESRVDARWAADLKAQLGKLVEEGRRRIVLDLSAVDFIDSSGLGAIVSSLRLLNGTGQIVICGVRQAVRTLFKVTRMDQLFHIASSEADALAALAS